MFTSILDFVIKYKVIFLFYFIIILFLYLKRKQLAYQAKVIILYRMKFGLNFIEKISTKFKQWIILIGYIGVGAGYVGLIFISYILIKNLIDLVIHPATTPGVSLVLPGITVPGLGVLPFWYWIIALFMIAIVHEFAHGIVARAHNISVKSTGLVFFGPIIGAFVEPNENAMTKKKDIVQYSVLAAGPFSNIILAIVALLLLNFIFLPLQENMLVPTGFTFDSYFAADLPTEKAGILPGTLITGVNNYSVTNFQQFSKKLSCLSPNQEITLTTKAQDKTEQNILVQLTANPEDSEQGFLGISSIRNDFELHSNYQFGFNKIIYSVITWLVGFLRWLFLLSLGIGLFNLLPLPIVDGGRIIQVTLHQIRGSEKGEKNYHQISLFFLLVLVLTLIYPWLSKLFGF